MFKKGQLVVNQLSGAYGVVTFDSYALVLVIGLGESKGRREHPSNLKLIGNNYRAKPKCSR